MLTLRITHPILGTASPHLLQVDMQARPGALVEVAGSSGVGKTTLFRILAGLTRPKKAFIATPHATWVDTEAGIFLRPQRRGVALMFQDYALFPHMSVYENIAFAQPRTPSIVIMDLLQQLDLTPLAATSARRLSGGQQQRVALARALAQEAPVLLLDEPFSAVDKALRIQMKQAILDAHLRRKSTTFVISHRPEDFKEEADIHLRIDAIPCTP